VKSRIMLTINAADQIVWKRSLREALLELDPKSFGKKLEAARQADVRLLELSQRPIRIPLRSTSYWTVCTPSVQSNS